MSERKIIIAVDGSSQSNYAVEWYLTNINRSHDHVILIHAAEYNIKWRSWGSYTPDEIQEITQQAKAENDRIENMLGTHLDKLREKRVRGTNVCVMGKKAGEAIIEQATKQNASMIVMGCRGLGTIRRTLVGSVSNYVACHAPANCAVIILRTN